MINFGDDKVFIENYERLKSSRKMGKLYGCDKKSITTHAKKIGYNYSSNKKVKVTNIPIEDLIAMYEELGTIKKVAEQLGCSGTAISNYFSKCGYKPNNTSKLSNISDEEFIASYRELKSSEKLGEKYGCSSVAILNHAKKIGYDTSENKEYKLSDIDKQVIIESYYDKSSTDLAKEYQVSRGMITKLWFDAGLTGKQVINSKTSEIDLTGQTFGYWSVLYKTNKRTAGGNIYWRCRCKCGIERDVSSLSLRQGVSLSCGSHSNISKGNEKIKNLLLEAGIPFELEKKFPTCKDKKELPFDFYIDDKYLIEYDGLQHFQESIFNYEYTHTHDLIKNQWCKNNNIPLIRIPYTHYKELCLEDLLLEQSSFIEIMPTIN